MMADKRGLVLHGNKDDAFAKSGEQIALKHSYNYCNCIHTNRIKLGGLLPPPPPPLSTPLLCTCWPFWNFAALYTSPGSKQKITCNVSYVTATEKPSHVR